MRDRRMIVASSHGLIMKTNMMHRTVSLCLASLLSWIGMTAMADARSHRHGGCQPARTIVTRYCHCGLPRYSERVFMGYDCHGRPMWGYREVGRHIHRVIRSGGCGPIRSYDSNAWMHRSW